MTAKNTQLATLVLGLCLALAGGAIKAIAVSREPEIISYVFFSGPDYLLLCAGLLLVALAVGFDYLFGPEVSDGPEESR